MFLSNFAVTFVFALVVGTGTQRQAIEINNPPGRLPTVEEKLRDYKVELTRPALVTALRNADPEVRYLAAQKLAQDKATEAIPAILDALESEGVERTRVNIAFALAKLGEKKGVTTLEDVCRDLRLPSYRRIQAANYVIVYLDDENEACRKGLVEILQSRPDTGSLSGAISLLGRIRTLSEHESQTMFQAAVGALGGADPSLRLAAGGALGEIGNADAIPYLERAVAKEQNEVVRSRMQATIQQLQQKQKQKQKQKQRHWPLITGH